MSDLISRKLVMDEVNSLTVTITGLRAGKGILNQFAEEYKKSILRILDEAPTAHDTEKTAEQKIICISKERLAGILIDYAEHVEDLPNWACDQTVDEAINWINKNYSTKSELLQEVE